MLRLAGLVILLVLPIGAQPIPAPPVQSQPIESQPVRTSPIGAQTAGTQPYRMPPFGADGLPFDVHALMQLERISDPQISPDGTTVAFVVQSVNLAENDMPRQVYTVPVTGGSPRRITWAGSDNHRPRWSPDSQRIAFISDRSGSSQVWLMQADGSSPTQVTVMPTEAGGVIYSRDGRNLVFTSRVYPECQDLACNARRMEMEAEDPVNVREYTGLLYRHWNEWDDTRVRQIFKVNVDGGEPVALTPASLDTPPFSLGGPDDYAISPDGTELCYVAKVDTEPATSTNTELFVVPMRGGDPVRLTTSPGADNSPRYSPDGKHLAWLRQMRGGYESDRWRLTVMSNRPAAIRPEMLEAESPRSFPEVFGPEVPEELAQQPDPLEKETGEDEMGLLGGETPAEPIEEPKVELPPEPLPTWEWNFATMVSLTDGLDRPVTSFRWSPDSTRIFFTTADRGQSAIQMIAINGGSIRPVVTGSSTLGDQQFTPDGRTMVYTEQTGERPPQIFAASATGGPSTQLTNLGFSILDRHELTPFEEIRVDGLDQTPIQSFLLKPPNFQPEERYPVVFLIHGGPQGAWGRNWSYRWNAQVIAGAGYVVVMPNPRGSIGYGQRFTDEINSDWGGKAYDDIMAVVDYVSGLPYVIPDRMAVAGGSYGGYMVDWMLGHTQRFRAMVSHAGVFNLSSFAMETEELWFPIWEFAGMPWQNPEMYERWSPDQFISDFFTPTLVIHGEQDFRVPYGQSLQLFTALQRQQVPSKLLIFPDEGHWIEKPANSVRWYEEVIAWLDRYLKGGDELTAPFPTAPESLIYPPTDSGLSTGDPTAPMTDAPLPDTMDPTGYRGILEPPPNDPASEQPPPERREPNIIIP